MAEGSLHSVPLVYVLVNKGLKAMRTGLTNIADNNERCRLPPECRASMTSHQIRNMARSQNTTSNFLSGTWCKETAIGVFQDGHKRKQKPLWMWYKNRLLPFGRTYPDGHFKQFQTSAEEELKRNTKEIVIKPAAEEETFPGSSDVIGIPSDITTEGRLDKTPESSPQTQPVNTPTPHLGTVVETRKRRPRTRGSLLNTDRKMWMSQRSRGDEGCESTGDRCSSDLSGVPNASPSARDDMPGAPKASTPAGDILKQAFGYDPSEDAFWNIKSQGALPDDVPSILGRQQVQFKRTDEDEYSVHGRGSTSTFFHATVEDTAVLVKDRTESNRPVAEVMTEAKVISSLSGTSVTPHLLGVLEQGVLEREYSLVLEDCTGFISLQDLLKSGYFVSRSGWTNICLTLASHLKTLHSRRVLHNNICSSNIIINKDTLEVKLVGFGQASFGKGVKLPSATRHQPGLAPEVRLGCVTSPQADVYALGSVLSEIKVASNLMDLHEVVQKCHQDLPRNRARAQEIHDFMQAAFNRCQG
ncbi:cytokinesis protein sepH-like [Haliotis rufescens]|uniref:cytokinesis protein sepH-like n=1 Tax=Haliotis rufescens TaxID=6454 RepID=UPI00201E7522|nr:cytokinesis protein sepH-like [Haliotis rufescens]